MDTKSVSAFLSSISTTYIWTTSLCCVCVCKLFYLLYPPAEYEHWIETVRIQYIFYIYIYIIMFQCPFKVIYILFTLALPASNVPIYMKIIQASCRSLSLGESNFPSMALVAILRSHASLVESQCDIRTSNAVLMKFGNWMGSPWSGTAYHE